jgi:hypothetical protein
MVFDACQGSPREGVDRGRRQYPSDPRVRDDVV